MIRRFSAAAFLLLASVSVSGAAEIRVMTTGAPKQVVDQVAKAFMASTGHTITLVQDTAGGVRRRIEAGEAADVIVATPDVLQTLAAAGRTVGPRLDFARTGVGVGVKEGVAPPDVSTVDAFKAFLTAAPSLALPDPKAGGTSAVYIEGLIKRLGLAEVVAPKAKLKAGGYAADLVASGDAIYVIHQISEIRPVKGVTLVGPLPADIQLITTYSAALAATAAQNEPARTFLAALGGPLALEAVQRVGMDPVK